MTAETPVETNISELAPGELRVVEWFGKPVWVMRRTKEQLDAIRTTEGKVADPASEEPLQPEYCKNEYRSIKPEFLVVVGLCTHRGCPPELKGADAKGEMGADWSGGFFCSCHGSKFDLAGRVFKGAPAPVNLEVPPHMYTSEGVLLIGADNEQAS